MSEPDANTVLTSVMPKRTIGFIRVCSFDSANKGTFHEGIDDRHAQDILVRAAQLINTVFEFEKIFQPLPALAYAAPAAAGAAGAAGAASGAAGAAGAASGAAGAAAGAAGAATEVKTEEQRRKIIWDTFCSPFLSLEAGVPVQDCYAVIDAESYKEGTRTLVRRIIGACILAKTPTHWAIWSVAGDPYRIRAKTFHHMFAEIKHNIRVEKGPFTVKLIASDAPVPFVTLDDRLHIYALEGFKVIPGTPLTGVDKDGRWGRVPVPNDGSYMCINLENPGDKLVMVAIVPPDESPLPPLSLPASMPMDVQATECLFSWGHSGYSVKTLPTEIELIPVNTGNVRVIVSSVPSSAAFASSGLYFYNMISELLKHVPFHMLLKIFPGIQLSKPPTMLRDGAVTQAMSKELYGGILIKLPTELYKPNEMMATNITSIYVYDVNTNIPDMGIGYSDPNPERHKTFGMYKVDTSRPFVMNVEGMPEKDARIFAKSERFTLPGQGTIRPGTVTTLGTILNALNSSPGDKQRVLIHGLCGSIVAPTKAREAATQIYAMRLRELHPKAVVLHTGSELVSFYSKLGTAILALTKQVAPVDAVSKGGRRRTVKKRRARQGNQ